MAYRNKNGNTFADEQVSNTPKVDYTEDNTKKIDELTETVNSLKAQNELLMKMLVEMQNNKTQSQPAAGYQPQGEIKLIHLIQNDPGLTTHIELTNLTIDMNAFGEERTLDIKQAEELVGKYRRFFDRGIIAFGAGSEDFAKRFSLKTVKDYSYLNKDFVKHLGGLSLTELENLYGKLSEGHKRFVIEYFKRKILEGDPAFKDIHKIELLNRLSNGAMSGTTLDLTREAETAAQKN